MGATANPNEFLGIAASQKSTQVGSSARFGCEGVPSRATTMKIGIVGMGWVGASVATSILHSGVATELLLDDAKPGLAEGEAMDLAHGASFYPTASVRAASIDEMVDANAVIIAAGKGGGPKDSRLELLRVNATIVHDIARRLSEMRGMLIIVTNPVDVMTQVAGVDSPKGAPDCTRGTQCRLRDHCEKRRDKSCHRPRDRCAAALDTPWGTTNCDHLARTGRRRGNSRCRDLTADDRGRQWGRRSHRARNGCGRTRGFGTLGRGAAASVSRGAKQALKRAAFLDQPADGSRTRPMNNGLETCAVVPC